MSDGFEHSRDLPGGNRKQGEAQPPDYTIDSQKRLVSVRFGKKLTTGIIAAYAVSLRENPLFEPDFSEVADLSAVEEIEMTPEQAMVLADAIDPFSLCSRRAFVASQQFQINSARLHQILRSPSKNIAIFDSVAKAEQWVCSETPQAPAINPGKTARVLQFLSRSRP